MSGTVDVGDGKAAWLLRVLGIDLAAAPSQAAPTGAAPDPDGMAAWEAARAAAVKELGSIGREIAAAKLPESAAALIELSAVSKQLTRRPESLRQVAELERWLGGDDVVADVCRFAGDIRTPLLGALARLRAGLGAGVGA